MAVSDLWALELLLAMTPLLGDPNVLPDPSWLT